MRKDWEPQLIDWYIEASFSSTSKFFNLDNLAISENIVFKQNVV